MTDLRATVARLIAGVRPAANEATRGLDVACLREVLSRCAISTAVDVGANVGRWSQMLRDDIGFRGPIVALEPDPALFEGLHARFADDRDWHGHQVAAGAERGSVALRRVVRAPGLNSLLDASAAGTDEFSAFDAIEEVLVDVVPLDELLASTVEPTDRLLVKIDTQGYERDVLEGAARTLALVAALQLEVPLTKLYDGMASAAELLTIVESAGFEIVEVIAGGRSSEGGRLLDLDVVAVRAGAWHS